jgi:hypothetical protein
MSIVSDVLINHWDDVAAVGVLVGGWIYAKARGRKTKTVREILDDIVRQVINADGVDLENVKPKAERAIRDTLAKAGIKGKAAEVLVHEFVEYAAAELAERYAEVNKALQKLNAATETAGKDMLAKIVELEKAQAGLERALAERPQ